MEHSKGNTVGIAKNSPSMRATHFSEPFQDFFPQNGKDNKPNHPLLLRLPYLRIKPKAQSQQRKK